MTRTSASSAPRERNPVPVSEGLQLYNARGYPVFEWECTNEVMCLDRVKGGCGSPFLAPWATWQDTSAPGTKHVVDQDILCEIMVEEEQLPARCGRIPQQTSFEPKEMLTTVPVPLPVAPGPRKER
ncbi:MAG: hypothetical protein KGJ23_08820 [Euryarchaeota archaeon]|nr:hypothetical protein [Euryarchaeota archaeon]MDE1836706.1 hypothetical protein [Euryarchaeota archaeon]MDE1880265.1 hypothetical protein [Euryarchaeota archaeon]MDE2044676.1 hypothetical protein [Thermoplasmata archaeon]